MEISSRPWKGGWGEIFLEVFFLREFLFSNQGKRCNNISFQNGSWTRPHAKRGKREKKKDHNSNCGYALRFRTSCSIFRNIFSPISASGKTMFVRFVEYSPHLLREASYSSLRGLISGSLFFFGAAADGIHHLKTFKLLHCKRMLETLFSLCIFNCKIVCFPK